MPYSPKTPEDIAVAQRFGRDLYEKRLRHENERELKLNGKARFCPVPIFKFILTIVFRVTFLWRRGYKNYLTPKVEEHPLTLPRLPKEFDGFRILHLSDLHLDLDEKFVAVIIEAIKGLKYDLCVITGDFNNLTVHKSGSAIPETEQLAKAIKAPIFACLGNHDSLLDVPYLEATGVKVLLNESEEFKHNGASIWIAGVDDANIYKTDDVARAFSVAPKDSFKLLLSHTPSTYAKAAANDVDLVLSGHVHGGQICLPNGKMLHKVIGWKNDPSPEKVWVGHWQEGDLTQGWTSRGVGSCGVPLRFNCPPEIGIIVLQAASMLEE